MTLQEPHSSSQRLGWPAFGALAALGLALVLTNRHFTFFDDETTIAFGSAQPAWHILHVFLRGIGANEHPPLYDLILHYWLRLTRERLWMLRLPSIACYLAGIWTLALAAGRLGGPRAGRTLLWIAVLWPYGFLYGRAVAWYSFSFLLVSLVTLTYLRLLESPRAGNWAFFAIFALALVWTNYYGWAMLGLMSADFFWRSRHDVHRLLRPAALVAGVLIVGYLPLARAFWTELATHPTEGGTSFLARGLFGIYGLYAMVVSEAMAPWFWRLGIPGAIATAILLLALAVGRQPGRRFYGFFCALYALMPVLGILTTRRLMLLGPWLLLPAATLIPEVTRARADRPTPVSSGPSGARVASWLALASLTVAFAIGWYGILVPRHYAAPRFIEPWQATARRAADIWDRGGIVIGNNPSFFFYLNYAIAERQGNRVPPLKASPNPRVFLSDEWLASGRPMSKLVFLAQGVPIHGATDPTLAAERWLDAHCRIERARRELRDSGYGRKERFFPEMGETPWRVETWLYACPASP